MEQAAAAFEAAALCWPLEAKGRELVCQELDAAVALDDSVNEWVDIRTYQRVPADAFWPCMSQHGYSFIHDAGSAKYSVSSTFTRKQATTF